MNCLPRCASSVGEAGVAVGQKRHGHFAGIRQVDSLSAVIRCSGTHLRVPLLSPPPPRRSPTETTDLIDAFLEL